MEKKKPPGSGTLAEPLALPLPNPGLGYHFALVPETLSPPSRFPPFSPGSDFLENEHRTSSANKLFSLLFNPPPHPPLQDTQHQHSKNLPPPSPHTYISTFCSVLLFFLLHKEWTPHC